MLFGITAVFRALSTMSNNRIFIGPVVHSERREKLTFLKKAAIVVDNGVITAIETSGDIESIPQYERYDVVELERGQFLCPGFVDLHTHAPQFPNVGLGYDKPLLEWLSTYTFPLEKRYSYIDFARNVYASFVETTLGCGTTTACYYATIHTDSAVELATQAAERGQRAIVGKVNMNRNSDPDYVETLEASLRETERFIWLVNELKNELVQPAVTPRFAISCDMELMKGLARIAKEHDCYIQTHISENKSEIEEVKKLFPECSSYTDVYKRAGLLTKKTILGHGIYLSDEERRTISDAGSSIAHCPISNWLLMSGSFCCRKTQEAGVKVGLGTDVSGGSSPSILETLRSALSTSFTVSSEEYSPLTYHEGFYLATMGGAEALGLEKVTGNFQVGKHMDALVVDMTSNSCGILDKHGLEDLFQKFVYVANDTNIKQVYVKGRLVKSRSG